MMAGWNIKKIKRWVFLGFSLWALLAFVAWHYESTCGMFLSGDCLTQYWDGVRHVLLLKWVQEFQALTAGVLALATAGAAIYATWLKIFEDRKNDVARTRDAARTDCLLASHVLLTTIDELMFALNKSTRTGHENFLKRITENERYLHCLYAICRPLGWEAYKTILDLRKFFLPAPNSHHVVDLKSVRVVIARMHAISVVLITISDKLAENGRYNFVTDGRIPSNVIASVLKSLKVKPSQLDRLYFMFEWNDQTL